MTKFSGESRAKGKGKAKGDDDEEEGGEEEGADLSKVCSNEYTPQTRTTMGR